MIDPQQEQIIADRRRLKIRPVDKERRPRWLRGRLGPLCRALHIQDSLRSLPYPLMWDHVGLSIGDAGEHILVSEPYLRREDVEVHVAQAAAMLGVAHRILPPEQSWHFPGQSLRIELFESPEGRSLEDHKRFCRQLRKDYLMTGRVPFSRRSLAVR